MQQTRAEEHETVVSFAGCEACEGTNHRSKVKVHHLLTRNGHNFLPKEKSVITFHPDPPSIVEVH